MSPRRGDLISQFLGFVIVGAAGFIVDAGVLILLLHSTHVGPYWGRVGSFLCAATATWYLNRTFTFAAQANSRWGVEWIRFLCANALGGSVNFGVYSTLTALERPFLSAPLFAVAVGSVSGLLVNFTLSRMYIFRQGLSEV